VLGGDELGASLRGVEKGEGTYSVGEVRAEEEERVGECGQRAQAASPVLKLYLYCTVLVCGRVKTVRVLDDQRRGHVSVLWLSENPILQGGEGCVCVARLSNGCQVAPEMDKAIVPSRPEKSSITIPGMSMVANCTAHGKGIRVYCIKNEEEAWIVDSLVE
jgi:hypothetical protein